MKITHSPHRVKKDSVFHKIGKNKGHEPIYHKWIELACFHYEKKNYMTCNSYMNRVLCFSQQIQYEDMSIIYFVKGKCFYYQKHYEQALSWFNYAIDLHFDIEYVYYIGDTHYHLKEYAEAMNVLLKGILADPLVPKLRDRCALVLSEFQEYELALDQINIAIALDQGQNGVFFNTRGNIYFQMDDYEKALTDFEKAFEIIPSPVIQANIDLCKTCLQEIQEVIHHFDCAAAAA